MISTFIRIGLLISAVAAMWYAMRADRTRIRSVALRVHRMPAMIAFYEEALGTRFTPVQTGAFTSQFAEVGGITVKFVPIRDSVEFEVFPLMQLGIVVDDVERVVRLATVHGGRLQDAPRREGRRTHAAIRDPDGNTVELHDRASPIPWRR